MTGAVLTVDLTAIARNAALFDAISPGFTAVVKADGFGHGASDVARTALAHGAARLGVTSVGEALALRADGVDAPILSWLNRIDADFGAAIAANVELAVGGVDVLDRVARATIHNGQARVHLFADTGMSREGASGEDWARLCRRAHDLERRGTVTVVGLMSHLACANEPGHPANGDALDRFDAATATAIGCGITSRHRHIAATAATLDIPRARLDTARVGAGLYGIDPSGPQRLRQAMTLTAPIVAVRDVPTDTVVGYGHTFRTSAPTRLALLPLGYADGIPRAAANTASVHIRGRRCPVVGAVSMDQIVVDAGDLPIRIGDTATIFGPGDRGEPRLSEWAVWCRTIEHDLMTGIGARVTRGTIPVHDASLEAAVNRHGLHDCLR